MNGPDLDEMRDWGPDRDSEARAVTEALESVSETTNILSRQTWHYTLWDRYRFARGREGIDPRELWDPDDELADWGPKMVLPHLLDILEAFGVDLDETSERQRARNIIGHITEPLHTLAEQREAEPLKGDNGRKDLDQLRRRSKNLRVKIGELTSREQRWIESSEHDGESIEDVFDEVHRAGATRPFEWPAILDRLCRALEDDAQHAIVEAKQKGQPNRTAAMGKLYVTFSETWDTYAEGDTSTSAEREAFDLLLETVGTTPPASGQTYRNWREAYEAHREEEDEPK